MRLIWKSSTHCSATAVVVEVHECPTIPDGSLFGINEGFGKFDPIVDIITASTPVKVSFSVVSSPPPEGVAVTQLELPLAAGTGQRIHDSR